MDILKLKAMLADDMETAFGGRLRLAVSATEQLRVDLLQVADVAQLSQDQLSNALYDRDMVVQRLAECEAERDALHEEGSECR